MVNKQLKYYDKIIFQENFIGSNKKNYFEGWYFKHKIGDKCICIIPGISIVNNREYAFIQVIDSITNKSYNIDYDIKYFKYFSNPFSIVIGNNYFGLDGINLDIQNDELYLKAEVKYSNITKIKTNKYMPNIMGPFAYINNMECNHSTISMFHDITGYFDINSNLIKFSNEIGYIEKDYGLSFPKTYIWLQTAEKINNTSISIFIAIADIPIFKTTFRGHICVIIYNNKEYRFSTYNGSKIVKYKAYNDKVYISLKNKNLKLMIELNSCGSNILKSPKLGSMDNIINESLNSKCKLELFENDNCIISELFENVTSEIKID